MLAVRREGVLHAAVCELTCRKCLQHAGAATLLSPQWVVRGNEPHTCWPCPTLLALLCSSVDMSSSLEDVTAALVPEAADAQLAPAADPAAAGASNGKKPSLLQVGHLLCGVCHSVHVARVWGW